MHREALESIIEETPAYAGIWNDVFARQLTANVLTQDDIMFLATYDAAASAALLYIVESDQAPIVSIGEPWDSNAPHMVVQDDLDFRLSEQYRAFAAVAEIYSITPKEASTNYETILTRATNWHNQHVQKR